MDVRLPEKSGAETAAAILKEFPEANILMLSTHSGEEEVFPFAASGSARIYAEERHARGTIARFAPRKVHAGRRYMDPAVAPLLAASV